MAEIGGPVIIEPAVIQDVIDAISDKVRANYIFPEVAEQICSNLIKHLEDGDYADINEGEFLAFALTTHMQEVNHDEHLWVRWHEESLPEENDSLRLNREWLDELQLKARLDNFGFHKVERLPGNIGYLDIRYFHRPNWGEDTATAAMNFLANTEALIIDLRKCTGGYPGMIALVASYLFGEEPIHLSSIYWRDEDKTEEYWTRTHLPGKRFVEKPVFVLTSKATFSAGEGFASVLQTRNRATVFGEKTDGGAHPGTAYRLHPHFEAFIPIGRAFDPLNGEDIDGIGVTPDHLLPHEQAFTAAYHMALEGVLTNLNNIPSGLSKDLAEETRMALKKMDSDHKFCPKCGYQNPRYMDKCKNCDEALPMEPVNLQSK